MTFRDVYLVSEKLAPLPPGEIAAFEDWLRERFGLPLPPDYREYMTSLGYGTYCDFVHVFSPAEVTTDFAPIGKPWGQHFFWDAGRDVLSEGQVERSFYVARTVDGDEIICSPEYPGELFVLPRHDDHIYRMPAGLRDPFAWDGAPPNVRPERPPFLYFTPDRDRAHVAFFTSLGTLQVDDLHRQFHARWRHAEFREIVGADYALLFPKAIGGRVQIVKEREGKGRVGIRIDYDSDDQLEINAAERMLTAQGMFVTGRHPASVLSSR